MHPSEIDQVLSSMCVLVDTREQKTEISERRYAQLGRPYRREQFSLKDTVVIERKNSIDELCMCFTSQRARFEREFQRAAKVGIKVYLLVENATFEAVYTGKYRSRMLPNSLVASILAWLSRYNCVLIFCKAETSGKLIRDILHYEMRETLDRMVDYE